MSSILIYVQSGSVYTTTYMSPFIYKYMKRTNVRY